jgi:hypothetical protein
MNQFDCALEQLLPAATAQPQYMQQIPARAHTTALCKVDIYTEHIACLNKLIHMTSSPRPTMAQFLKSQHMYRARAADTLDSVFAQLSNPRVLPAMLKDMLHVV